MNTIFDQAIITITSHKNLKLLAILAGSLIILGLGGAGYWFYKSSINASGHTAFAQCLEEYNNALQKDDATLWHEFEIACTTEFERHSRADVAPYFKILMVDALLFQHKPAEALKLLQDALELIPSASPFYYLFKTKQALIEYDTTGSSQLLEQLAQKVKNPYRDMAQFYIGYYPWLAGDVAQATERWQVLLQQPQSVWSQRASAELKYAA